MQRAEFCAGDPCGCADWTAGGGDVGCTVGGDGDGLDDGVGEGRVCVVEDDGAVCVDDDEGVVYVGEVYDGCCEGRDGWYGVVWVDEDDGVVCVGGEYDGCEDRDGWFDCDGYDCDG
jgi:hypothetical protein